MTDFQSTLDHVKRALSRKDTAISSDFDLNPGGRPEQFVNARMRPAAVLLALVEGKNGLNVILTKRASHLKHHPGQIAFPGGKVEATDTNTIAAALREANEEIGLPDGYVEVLGLLPIHETITSFEVTPVVGFVRERFAPIPEIGEVEEVFEVPLSYLTKPENFLVEGRFWGGQKRHYHVIPYGPYYIWGATARMLLAFAQQVSR